METYEFNITDKEQTGIRVDKLLPELNNDWSRCFNSHFSIYLHYV